MALCLHVATVGADEEAPKPENISGYRPYRMDVQPGDWRTY
jgi:hypothetical protein